MSTKVNIKLDYLKALKPLTFTEDDAIKQNFIYLYRQVQTDDQDEAEAFYEKESNYFKRRLFDVPDLQGATIFSLYSCFMDIVLNGLSFDPDAKLVYLEINNVNVSPKDQQAVWERRAKLVISPYGELAIRIEAGHLKYIDEPVIVYGCDTIKIRTNDQGNKVIIYEGVIPRTSTKIIASFVKLTRTDNSFDFKYLLEDDIARLMAYSEKRNKGKTNALYTSANQGIDPGFLAAKTIKHAFKTFPKIKIKGTNSSLDGDDEPTQTEVQVYDEQPPAGPSANKPAAQPARNDFDDDFSAPAVTQPQANGVTIDDDDF